MVEEGLEGLLLAFALCLPPVQTSVLTIMSKCAQIRVERLMNRDLHESSP